MKSMCKLRKCKNTSKKTVGIFSMGIKLRILKKEIMHKKINFSCTRNYKKKMSYFCFIQLLFYLYLFCNWNLQRNEICEIVNLKIYEYNPDTFDYIWF